MGETSVIQRERCDAKLSMVKARAGVKGIEF
jgi:hypothetical protein